MMVLHMTFGMLRLLGLPKNLKRLKCSTSSSLFRIRKFGIHSTINDEPVNPGTGPASAEPVHKSLELPGNALNTSGSKAVSKFDTIKGS